MVDWHPYIWVLFKTANTVAVGPHGRTQLLTLLTTQAGGKEELGPTILFQRPLTGPCYSKALQPPSNIKPLMRTHGPLEDTENPN